MIWLRGLLPVMTLIFPAIANAETMRFIDLSDEQKATIERGTPWPDLACYHWSVADMIYRYGVDPELLFVTFNDPAVDGIAIEADESGFYRTCENGLLREWDAGDAMVIHDFNY